MKYPIRIVRPDALAAALGNETEEKARWKRRQKKTDKLMKLMKRIKRIKRING